MDCSVSNTLPKPKVVSVNGVVIAREVIAREVQNHPAEKPVLAWHAAARALVVRELLLQESRRLGIEAEPLRDPEGRSETPEEAAMRALIEREVVTPEPDEAACLRFYQQNRERFRSGDLYEAAHILVAAPPGDMTARTRARAFSSLITSWRRAARFTITSPRMAAACMQRVRLSSTIQPSRTMVRGATEAAFMPTRRARCI